jgi:hypothetical protein
MIIENSIMDSDWIRLEYGILKIKIPELRRKFSEQF